METNTSLCFFEQTIASQSLGYLNALLVMLHALPTFISQCKRKQFTAPILSLFTRTLLACSTIPYGILICQWPVICSGSASLFIFVLIWIQFCVYKQHKRVQDISTQTKAGSRHAQD